MCLGGGGGGGGSISLCWAGQLVAVSSSVYPYTGMLSRYFVENYYIEETPGSTTYPYYGNLV